MDNKINNLREFRKFRLDAEKRVLWYEDKPVNLALKEIELLCALTEQGGAVVSKDELMDKVWKESFVEESNLSRHIYILRKTFDALGEKKLIQTISGRGYRFTADVREIRDGEIVIERRALTETVIEIQEEEMGRKGDGEKGRKGENDNFFKRRFSFLSSHLPFSLSPLLVLIIALAVVGFAVWRYQKRQTTTHLAEIKSIAVLPFKTIDANKENEHHGLGLTDILITRLSNIKELNVRPTSAVFALGNEDSISAGQKLKVDAVLEGTIYRTNEKVRVTVRLLKVGDGASIWAAQFEQPLQDELKLQDEIALQMIDALAMDLTGSEKTALTKRFTESAEAYQLYLKGRYEWNKRNSPGMREAERLFRNAIEKDPKFALAYVGLADTMATKQGDSEGGVLISKALEIDPNLAEAHATRGFREMFHGWNWQIAGTAFKKSIELNPNYATAHHWYATLLTIQGRHEEAKAEMRRALEINPLSHNYLVDMGQIYYHNREYDKAKEYCFKSLEIYPDFTFAHNYLYFIYLQTGEYEKAVESYIKFHELELNVATAPTEYKKSHAGFAEEMRRRFREGGIEKFMLDEFKVHEFDGSSFYLSAMRNAFLGKKQITLDHLEKAVESRSFLCPFAKSDPIFDSLRDEPRFYEILRKMNLND